MVSKMSTPLKNVLNLQEIQPPTEPQEQTTLDKAKAWTANARRHEILKLEGLGLSRAEVVKELSQKAHCSERTIYNDYQTRPNWQPILQSPTETNDQLLKITNRYEQIYRQASLRFLTSPNEQVRIHALKIMLATNTQLHQTVVLPELLNRLKMLEEKAAKGVFVP